MSTQRWSLDCAALPFYVLSTLPNTCSPSCTNMLATSHCLPSHIMMSPPAPSDGVPWSNQAPLSWIHQSGSAFSA